MAYAAIFQEYQSWTFDQVVAPSLLIPETITADSTDSADGQDLHEGDPVGRLEIPRIGMSIIVLQGIDERTLILGVGHVPGTPLPGIEANVVLAGHKDTFFRPLKTIAPGDEVIFSTPKGRFEYVVDFTEIVGPEDTYVMESRGHGELTLITCYPFYFVGAAPERFIVHARPVEGTDQLGGVKTPADTVKITHGPRGALQQGR